uniref:PAT complex subunit Asterix n=1 Tax=Oncorhynchus mykiss TaxID=8022 RepID=A0A8K9VBF6_ONCMY
MSANNMSGPQRVNKIIRYKPPSTEANPTLEDPTPDYMNLLGMIFSMCGLMLKLKWCAWIAVYCSFISFANSRSSEDTKQMMSSSMLSPLYADGSVIVERRVPAPALWPADGMPPTSQNHRPLRCHPPPTSGSSVCANPTYYHAVYDVRVDKCRDAPFLSGRGKAGRGPGGSLALVAADGDPLAPPVRRRGGLVDHRDVIKAHQSHKLQSTPQARRKEWE